MPSSRERQLVIAVGIETRLGNVAFGNIVMRRAERRLAVYVVLLRTCLCTSNSWPSHVPLLQHTAEY